MLEIRSALILPRCGETMNTLISAECLAHFHARIDQQACPARAGANLKGTRKPPETADSAQQTGASVLVNPPDCRRTPIPSEGMAPSPLCSNRADPLNTSGI